jgi:hypothetical protein
VAEPRPGSLNGNLRIADSASHPDEGIGDRIARRRAVGEAVAVFGAHDRYCGVRLEDDDALRAGKLPNALKAKFPCTEGLLDSADKRSKKGALYENFRHPPARDLAGPHEIPAL